jgi:hypothetical protein
MFTKHVDHIEFYIFVIQIVECYMFSFNMCTVNNIFGHLNDMKIAESMKDNRWNFPLMTKASEKSNPKEEF